MRIGFDAKRAFNNFSGLGSYGRYVISNIRRFYPENECLLYTPGIDYKELFQKPDGTVIRKPGKHPWNLKGSFWRSFGLTHQLNKDGIELFHGLSNELPFGIRRSKVRSVVTIHDLIFMEHPMFYKLVDRKIYYQKVRYAVKAANRIIAVSQLTKQDIIRFLDVDESRISVVYQGCSRQFYKRVSENLMLNVHRQFALPSEYLLYVGTIEERKNLLSVIMAMHHGKIDLPLVVVGKKTDYFNLVNEYIEKHKVKNIRFLDHVRNNDLPAIYQGASAFIYPSSYEGFGIPILEALNSGVPVITSRGGCLEETAGKGGLLIDPFDQEEMIEAIRQVMEDSALKDRLIREGGAHALKFREDQTIPALYDVYLKSIND